MSWMTQSRAFLLSLLLAANTHADSGKTLSITIDDLPWVSLPNRAPTDLAVRHRTLLAKLRAADVPAIGFVNEYKLYDAKALSEERVQMLRDWLDAGFTLGNHTRDHIDLHRTDMRDFQRNILEGEVVLRPLLAEFDSVPLWFRHPYLHAGRSDSERTELKAFLDAHNYRIAPVTIDNSEWIFAKAYRDCELNPDCTKADRKRVINSYVPYMRDKIRYYEAQSQLFFGRQIAQVLLLHANELNAASIDSLIDMIRAEGYAFVSLDTAMTDPVYQKAIGYNGAAGPSWIHRYGLAMGFSGKDFAGEPTVPAWVLTMASVDQE